MPYHHDLFIPERTTSGDLGRIVRRVTDAAGCRVGPLDEVQEVRRKVAARERERERAELFQRVDEQLAAIAPPDTPAAAGLVETVHALQKELDGAWSIALESDGRAAAVQQELDHAEAELQSLRNSTAFLKQENVRLRAGGVPEDEFDNAEAAFLAEVRAEHSTRGLDPPLRRMSLHPDFLDALNQLQGVGRAKVVQVCAEVACGVAADLGSRAVHQLRVNPVGNSPQRVRLRDQAKAFRCSLQKGTASARRLHWWDLPDGGGVEFAHVGVHDDDHCPE